MLKTLTSTSPPFLSLIYSDFLPGTGKLVHMSTPTPSSHVRIDTGVRQGDEISIYYDPMIAKLVVWDNDRNAALQRLRVALDDYKVKIFFGQQKSNLEIFFSMVNFFFRLLDVPQIQDS